MSALVYRSGVVESRRGDAVRIAFGSPSGCLACAKGYGCGIGPLVDAFRAPARMNLRLAAGLAATLAPGTRVRVAVGARALLFHAALAYLIPLAGLLAGAAAASHFAQLGDLASVAGAVSGLLLGGGLSRGWARRRRPGGGLSPQLSILADPA